jgi:hypothetical protein
MNEEIITYDFEGCNLTLLEERGAYWVNIVSLDPELYWTMTTSFPKRRPDEAFALAELMVIKTNFRMDSCATLLIEINQNEEPILAVNTLCRQLLGHNITGSLLLEHMHDKKQYKNFLDTAKNVGHISQCLDVLDKEENVLKLKAEGRIIKSPVSQMEKLYIAIKPF